MSLAFVGFSILGLFSSWKPGGPVESSPEEDPLCVEAACSAFIKLKMEDSTSAGAAKEASLSTMAAAVVLGSSPTAPTVAGTEVTGCSANWGDTGLTPELCIITDVCSDGGAFMIGLELDPMPLIIGATPRRCLSCKTRSASARATYLRD